MPRRLYRTVLIFMVHTYLYYKQRSDKFIRVNFNNLVMKEKVKVVRERSAKDIKDAKTRETFEKVNKYFNALFK